MDYPISFYSGTDGIYRLDFDIIDIGIPTTTIISSHTGILQEYPTSWFTTDGTVIDSFINTNGDTSSYVAISSSLETISATVCTTITGGTVSYAYFAGGGSTIYSDFPELNTTTFVNSNATAYGTFLKIPSGYVGSITQTDSTTSYVVSDILWTFEQSYLEIAATTLAGFLDFSTTTIAAPGDGYPILTGSYGQWQSTSTSSSTSEPSQTVTNFEGYTYTVDSFSYSESGSTAADTVFSVTSAWTNVTTSMVPDGTGFDQGFIFGSDNAVSSVDVSQFATAITELPTFSQITSYTFVTMTNGLAFGNGIGFSKNTTDREISLWKENMLTYNKAYRGNDFLIFPTASSTYSSSWSYDFPANDYGQITSFLIPVWHDVPSTANYDDLTSSFFSVYPFGFSSFGSYTQEVQEVGNRCVSTFAFTCQKTSPAPYLRVWKSGGSGSATSISSLALSGIGGNWNDLSNTRYALNFGTLEHSILELQFSTGYQQPDYFVPNSEAYAFKIVNPYPAYLQNGKSFTFQIGATSLISSSTISTYHTTLIEITDGEIDQTSFETSYMANVGEVMDGSYTFEGLVAFTTWEGTNNSSTWSNFSKKTTFEKYSSTNSFIEFGSIFSAVGDCYLPFTVSNH